MSVTYFLFGRSSQGGIHSLILYTFCPQRNSCYIKRKYIFRKVTVFIILRMFVCQNSFKCTCACAYLFSTIFFAVLSAFGFFSFFQPLFLSFFFLDSFLCCSCFFLPSFPFYFLLFYFLWQRFFHRPSFSYLTTFSNALSKHFYSFTCFLVPVLVYLSILSFTAFDIIFTVSA